PPPPGRPSYESRLYKPFLLSLSLLFFLVLLFEVTTYHRTGQTASSLSLHPSSFQEYEVFLVDGNALAACFVKAGEITEEFCKELAKRKPLRVVFRDAGFKDDSVKINVEQIFKLMSPGTDVRTI
ncbi:MAG: hypothetical protein PHO37_11930, partial [Kiritimatiellae bacterium]|nr:hypothetical protein [Kiritimatiellia bacterium]